MIRHTTTPEPAKQTRPSYMPMVREGKDGKPGLVTKWDMIVEVEGAVAICSDGSGWASIPPSLLPTWGKNTPQDCACMDSAVVGTNQPCCKPQNHRSAAWTRVR